ncbi:uncharacterized protein LOC135841679 isoform X2 [Planococcus citri]|uniref:uncharacterized protein LOC135841679 isoform X2 n=1 Tax=Planococcus citri TaxID=170843 RepID=UPI0031F7C0E2
MRFLILLGAIILYVNLLKSHFQSYAIVMNERLQNSCEISENNFNRSCIYHKIVYLIEQLPYVSNFSPLQAGPVQLVKLPEYATSIMSVSEEKPKFRSYSSNIISLISKSLEFFMESYGIKIPIPSLTKNYPGIVVEEYTNASEQIGEGRARRKKKDKKFAMVFPLIATFKFILIKALLIPILMGIIAIKKMLVVAAMAVPTVIAMLRICRFGPGGFFPGAGGLQAAAATAPVLAPYVATSDTIIGDFSNYNPLAYSNPYHANKQQQADYGGKSFY